MTRSLSLALGELADFTTKAVAVQQRWLGLSAKAVRDKLIALDYILAGQEGVCPMADTAGCTWTSTSGKVETQLNKIRKQAHWLQEILPHSLLSFDLFSWLPSGLGLWFRAIIQAWFVILLLILLCIIISKLCTYCPSNLEETTPPIRWC